MTRTSLVSIMAAALIIMLAAVIETDLEANITKASNSDALEPLAHNGNALANKQLSKSGSSQVPSSLKNTLPSSLSGTSHGVALVTHQDNLIITASLKDLFDYYLSAGGEESLGIIESRIKEDLASQLSDTALTQALDIWQNYLTYKTSLVEFDQQYQTNVAALSNSENLQFLQQRQLALIALQDQLFSESIAEILFAFDRQLDNHTLEKAKLLASDLTEEQKQQSLINLKAQLPFEIVLSADRNEKQKTLLTIGQTENLTTEQKYNLRAESVGEAAASRLQKLDEQRHQWQQRINDFKQQKQQLSEAGLALEDYQLSLEKLYQQQFLPAEQLRARALTKTTE